ncbi:MAG: esterase-like activity of phytase family protein [Sphingopyxis sp.]|nr:esterase-like activity of phytase family protein [Sphingopyxis sp.]
MRRLLIALSLFVLLGPLPGSQRELPPRTYDQTLTVRAIADAPPGLRIGALTLVEAWEMSSRHSDFGGLSGVVLTGVREFLMVGDAGYRLRFGLSEAGQVRLGGYVKMPPPHPGYDGKFHFDAEAVAHDSVTGRYWTAMEGTGQIWCFGANDVRRVRTRQPILDAWPDNGGAEVLTRLPDGRFIALSERTGPSGHYEGVLFSSDPADPKTTTTRFYHDPGRQGVTTDAAALPDGRIS